MSETIVRRVRQHVEQAPEKELWRFLDLATGSVSRLSYAGLWKAGTHIAGALERFEHPRVLIVLPLGTRLLEAHFGTLMAGGWPAIHAHPSAKVAMEVYLKHLRHVATHMAPDVVLTNAQFKAGIREAFDGPVLDIEALESVPSLAPWKMVQPDHVALVQYSSGSTGLQKGVALTHEMVLAQCDAYARAIRLDPDLDRIASWIPLYHDMGLFTSWLLPLTQGVPVSAIDPFEWVGQPLSFLKLASEDTATLAWMPNFAYNLLASRAREEDLEDLDLSCMRGFNNCSEPVRATSHETFLDRFASVGVRADALWTCYAMAENSFAATSAGHPGVEPRTLTVERGRFADGEIRVATEADPDRLTLVSCGQPIPGCEVQIREGREPAALSRVGEIALRSPYTLSHYHDNPEATAAAIVDGWYHTGDLGFLHDGHLYVTGRKKDLLIVGGRNFYPQDIEAVVDDVEGSVPGRSVAIGVDDDRTGTQRIVVLAESKNEASTYEALEAAIRDRVLDKLDCPLSEVHAVPHMWLLKTTSGKIARAPNLERFREQAPSAEALPAARGGWVQSVAWGLAAGLALYTIWALQPNLSWGIYAGF